MQEMEFDTVRVKALYDRLYNGIAEKIPHIVLNGDAEQR